jgi:hypothetical protein
MAEKEELVSLKEAKEQVAIAIRRVALLHLSFSKTMADELGQQKGRELILKAIMEYGRRIGEGVKQGFPDLPKYGVHGGRKNGRVYDCVLSRTFKEYGEEDLGCFYCYVDPAKTMTTDPTHKVIHKDCAACGDEYCTFETLPTTEKERRDFLTRNPDWRTVDPRLAKGR